MPELLSVRLQDFVNCGQSKLREYPAALTHLTARGDHETPAGSILLGAREIWMYADKYIPSSVLIRTWL